MVVRLVAVAAAATLFGGIIGALTASTTVPTSNAGETVHSLSVNEIAPAACSGIALQDIIIGSGNIQGTANNDLILGSSGSDTLNGNGGNDCMVGGNHGTTKDNFKGGAGNDVCIGDGANRDAYNSCATIVNR